MWKIACPIKKKTGHFREKPAFITISVSLVWGSIGTWSGEGIVWGEFWVLMRKLKEKRQESCDLSFLKKKPTELFLAWAFVIADRSEFMSDYSLQLSVVICLYATAVHLVTEHVTLLNSQSTNCLMLWIKSAIAWNFNWPYSLTPFSLSLPARAVNGSDNIRAPYINA